jgi:hypothetical protein
MRDTLLVLHFLGLAMALGAGFSNIFLGRAAAKMEPAERASFLSKTLVLAPMGQIGLGLLILSGGGLATPYWKTLASMPLFIAKLCLVGYLLLSIITILIMVSRAKKSGNMGVLAKLKPLAMINFFVALTIVVLAVLSFH